MKNVFEYEPKKHILAFTTQSGHVTGDLMKQIKFRSPDTIVKLQQRISNGAEIGDIFVIGCYVFVVLRKHYNSKIKNEDFEVLMNKITPELSEYTLKTTNEDYPKLREIIENYLPDIEYCDTSAWGTWKK